jgi:hypothetical protein
LSLLIDATTFILLIHQVIDRLTPGSQNARHVALFLTGLAVVMLGGVGLWTAGRPLAAVLLAGGPPAIAAVIYGAFFWTLMIKHP